MFGSSLLQLFVGGLMSYLHQLCLLVYSGVQHTLCCVFVLFFLVLCTLCNQFLWIVNFLSAPSRYCTPFIYLINLELHTRFYYLFVRGSFRNFYYSYVSRLLIYKKCCFNKNFRNINEPSVFSNVSLLLYNTFNNGGIFTFHYICKQGSRLLN